MIQAANCQRDDYRQNTRKHCAATERRRTLKARTNNALGFTLVEILLVILILTMLTGVFIAVVGPTREGARIDTTRLLVETTVPEALDRYNMHVGHYPSEEEGGVKALITKPAFQEEETGEKWRGPYIKHEPKDAWGQPLNYEVVDPSAGESIAVGYKVWSNGPDKQSGTEDDIKSWKEEQQM